MNFTYLKENIKDYAISSAVMPFAFKIRTFDLRISVYVTLLSNSGIESMLLKISIVNICKYMIVTD